MVHSGNFYWWKKRLRAAGPDGLRPPLTKFVEVKWTPAVPERDVGEGRATGPTHRVRGKQLILQSIGACTLLYSYREDMWLLPFAPPVSISVSWRKMSLRLLEIQIWLSFFPCAVSSWVL